MKKFVLFTTIFLMVGASACQVRIDTGSPAQSDQVAVITATEEIVPLVFSGSTALKVDPGFDLLFTGETEQASAYYQKRFEQAKDNEEKAIALLGLGRAQMLSRNWRGAVDTYNRLLGQYSGTEVEADAYFLLGQCYEEIDEPLYAANAYAKYSELNPNLIDGFVRRLQGDAALAAGDFRGAIFAYQASQQAIPSANSNYTSIQIGKAYMGLQDYATAAQTFLSAYENAQDDYTRATATLLAGQSYLELGRTEEAHTRFMETVIKFPKAYDSFTALSILVKDGVPVDELQRGIVDYYAGSYDFAITAFDRFLTGNPEHDGTVYFFKGLSHYFKGDTERALDAYQKLIDGYPNNLFWPNAWDEKAYILWTSKKQYTTAANTLLSFVSAAPENANAPAYMYEAGRIFERGNLLKEAGETWEKLMDAYPGYDQSYRALFLAGVTRYRMAEFERAYTLFQRTLVLATNGSERAAAYLWMGKVSMARNNEDAAREEWSQAQKADPTDFYGIRAGDLLADITPFSPTLGFDLGYDLNTEKAEADSWIRENFYVAAGIDIDDMSEITNQAGFQRALAYWKLGLFGNAVSEIENLKKQYAADGLKLYQLTNLLLEMRLYRQAILTCRELLNLKGLDDLSSLAVPVYFTHIRFGAYFRAQVAEAANTYNVDALTLFALLRQESLFEPFATSSAGASGLAQIMPATGREIADRLGWPIGYTNQDVYLAKVSIIFGASYLSRMEQFFDGNKMYALAAYNSGAGNVSSWVELSNSDPDLFVELIRFEETQNYLKQIGEYLNIYKLVYSRDQ